MIALVRIVLRLLADLAGLVVLSVRPRRSVEAENFFLRRELALYRERGVKPRRVDAATRVSLALLSQLFDWRDALVVVRPETLIRWHRAGWRLFWRCKAGPGRPPIPLEMRQLIRRVATENPLWGEERIANELLLKLGLRVLPRTVRKSMPKLPPGTSMCWQRRRRAPNRCRKTCGGMCDANNCGAQARRLPLLTSPFHYAAPTY